MKREPKLVKYVSALNYCFTGCDNRNLSSFRIRVVTDNMILHCLKVSSSLLRIMYNVNPMNSHLFRKASL